MSAEYDATEFVDTDFQTHKTLTGATATGTAALSASLKPRAPNREEVDARLTDTQRQIAELQRAQEEVQRKRDALAEVRRRQTEFEAGRPEMIAHLTRGLSLLEKAEFSARRDAEQMARTLADFQEALRKLQMIDPQTWSQESFDVELTRALTAIENARMEWNSARLKFSVLAGDTGSGTGAEAEKPPPPALTELSLLQLCKLGLGLTLPLAIVALLATALLAVIWLRGH
jgi:chromosome segregation ATPase